MTNLALSFSDIYKEISNFLGLSMAPSGDNLALVQKYANDGYRLFLMGVDPRSGRAYQWSFLAPAAELDVWPDVQAAAGLSVTGVCASGITTLTASPAPGPGPCCGPFYPSMVGRTIRITDVGAFTITGCPSAGTLLVSGDATGGSAGGPGKTFSIFSDGSFGLPAGFAAIIDDPAFSPGDFASAGPFAISDGRIAPRSTAYIRQLYAAALPAAGAPLHYSVLPRAFSPSDGQRYDMLIWPAPNTHYRLRLRYRLEPDAMATDADQPLGGPQHALTVLQAGLAVAEQRHNDLRGMHTEQFERQMAFSIEMYLLLSRKRI